MPLYRLISKSGEIHNGPCDCGCGMIPDPGRLQFIDLDSAKHYKEQYKLTGVFPRIVVDDSWIKRENERFSRGDYQPPVWENEAFWLNAPESVKLLYAHISIDDANNIGYTETPEKGMLDVHTKTTPGKFLKKHSKELGITDADVEYWANKHREEWSDDIMLKWADTPDDIQHVYTMPAGFSSCMQHPVEHFHSHSLLKDQHPTRIYGAGDLSVAYLVRGGRLISRALVWKDKKKVGRIYGDGERLRKALKSAGYTTKSDGSSYDTFAGARLLRIPIQAGYLAPYIDGMPRVNEHQDKEFLVLDNAGKIAFQQTDGIAANFARCCICSGTSGLQYLHSLNDDTEDSLTRTYYCSEHHENLALDGWRDEYSGMYYMNDVPKVPYFYGPEAEVRYTALDKRLLRDNFLRNVQGANSPTDLYATNAVTKFYTKDIQACYGTVKWVREHCIKAIDNFMYSNDACQPAYAADGVNVETYIPDHLVTGTGKKLISGRNGIYQLVDGIWKNTTRNDMFPYGIEKTSGSARNIGAGGTGGATTITIYT